MKNRKRTELLMLPMERYIYNRRFGERSGVPRSGSDTKKRGKEQAPGIPGRSYPKRKNRSSFMKNATIALLTILISFLVILLLAGSLIRAIN
jgi:hypothetical protein